MRRVLSVCLLILVTLVLWAPGASAHVSHDPCNDTDGDGSPSGREYAAHHISAQAKMGDIGGGGHVPGIHHGFSVCL